MEIVPLTPLSRLPYFPQKRSVRLRAAFLSRALPLRACVTLLREEAAKAAVTIFS